MKQARVINCERCKFRAFKRGSSGIADIKIVCKKGKRDFSNIPDSKYEEEMNKQIDCEEFKSRYIEYPIEVSGINQPDGGGIRTDSVFAKCGQLVKVRPCNEKYENKTYLGILLGEADIGIMISHNPDNQELSIHRHYNPAIFVPELKDIIYGISSWWGKINSEEELKEITNDDIDNVWYVRMLKGVEDDK